MTLLNDAELLNKKRLKEKQTELLANCLLQKDIELTLHIRNSIRLQEKMDKISMAESISDLPSNGEISTGYC